MDCVTLITFNKNSTVLLSIRTQTGCAVVTHAVQYAYSSDLSCLRSEMYAYLSPPHTAQI